MQAKENFELVSHNYVKEYQSDFYLYSHKKSKARVLFIENDDENKVFNISFRTPVNNSKGIPHILEHSVLNGSKNYPLKEPFVDIIKSSMSTFINALTYPDRTCYPVASTNKQDLYNLSKVYLDAVFNPLLDKKVFLQEGWHYELENDNQELSIKGVVYNEMKGVFSDPDNYFFYKLYNNLNPDNSYQYESGGSPEDIPNLTYQEFLDFHKKYYHPSNSYIFFYGNDRSDQRFEIIDEYLSNYEYEPKTFQDSVITKQPFWNEPRTFEYEFDPGNTETKEPKSQTAIAWLLQDTNPYQLMILQDLLLGNPSSVLYKALMESGYGDNLSCGAGMEDDIVQTFFSVGMQGVKPDKVDDLHNFIFDTLQTIADDGFDPKDVQAAINSNEFALREFNSTSQPKGLSLIFEIMSKWIYEGKDYLDYISYQSQIDSIKAEYKKNPNLFSEMIQELLLDNQHYLKVISRPKKGYNQELAQNYHKDLQDKLSTLSADQINDIKQNQEVLEEFRAKEDSPEDKAKLPTLKVSDISKDSKYYPYSLTNINDQNFLLTNYPTNDIVYVRLSFDISSTSNTNLQYLPLLLRTFKYLDTENYSNQEFNQELNIHTGNFSSSLYFSESNDHKELNKVIISAKSIANKLPKLVELISEVINKQKLDNKKIVKQLLTDEVSSFESSFVSSGYSFALSSLSSLLSNQDNYGEITGGLSQYYFLKDLLKNFEDNYKKILQSFVELKDQIFTQDNLLISITHDNTESIDKKLFKNIVPNKTNNSDTSLQPMKLEYTSHNAFLIPSKINYVCKGIDLYKQGYKYDGSIIPIIQLINLDYLWNEVRAKGGAYGCKVQFNKYSGILSFFSYRDPQLKNTLQVYSRLSEYLSSYQLTEENKKNFIISSIGKIDTHLLPSQIGTHNLDLHLKGLSLEDLQKTRDQVFAFDESKIHEFAKYLKNFDENAVESIFMHNPKDLPDQQEYKIIKL